METEIKACAIITGAPEIEIEYYKEYLNNRYIIAADSGYKKCVELSIKPDLIVGDFDSMDKPSVDVEIIDLPVRKDDTDTFYTVKLAIDKGFNDIIILGGIGSRFDHTYANVLSVNYCEDNGASCRLINKNNSISIIKDEAIIKSDGYKYFSLYAFMGECEGISISGADYNVSNVNMKPYEQFAQSNGFVGNDVTIKINKGKLLLIKSND